VAIDHSKAEGKVRDNFKAAEVAMDHSEAKVMVRDNCKAEEVKDHSKAES